MLRNQPLIKNEYCEAIPAEISTLAHFVHSPAMTLPNRTLLASMLVLSCWTFLSAVYAQNQIENLVVTQSEDDESALVIIESKQPLKYKISEVAEPTPQIQIQMMERTLCREDSPDIESKKLVQKIEYLCQDSPDARLPGQLLSAISILLNQPVTFSDSQKEWALSLTLKKESHQQSSPVSEPPFSPVFEEGLVPPKRILSDRPDVKEFVQVGLANHKPLEIAQQELNLARRKLFEARRNFFPALAGRASQVEGKTQTDPNDPITRADFIRKEIGIEIGQPLFQSGRIYYSEKQAGTQKEIAELQVVRIAGETTFEILKNLYTFLHLKESLHLRKAMQEESQKIMETTKRKKDIGLVSESELLGVLAAANQMEYKMVSLEKDIEIARTKLLSILNLESLPEELPMALDELAEEWAVKEMNLASLLNSAMANRAELKIVQLTAKFKEYGRKVAGAGTLFKVDASAFLGQSGAAFRSEPLTMRNSYNLGVKGILYFGGSSISPMASTEKTAPDLGTTSRTETAAQSLTIGLLDSLGAGSNLSQAKIEEEKAKEDLRKVKKDVLLEVKESFFNYQKAILQMDSARKELEYRSKEVAIAQAKDRLHQIEATQLLQALAGLKEAEVGMKEATAFYLISIAAMEKATGTTLSPAR